MSFTSLGLMPEILRSISETGYSEPTPIQREAIPFVLAGRDLLAGAQTGTGKTAGFTLPLLQRLSEHPQDERKKPIRALILTPTRELAAQIENSVKTYGKYLPLTSTVIFGGVKAGSQISRLRKGVDILVATPGRLLDLYNQKAVNFSKVETFILDEADRMLDMGFIRDIRKIINLLPKERQNLLFSATFSTDIKRLTDSLLINPAKVQVAQQNTTADRVEQRIHLVDQKRKAELLLHLIKTEKWEQALVFTRTKHGADKLTKQLKHKGIKTVAIHGNKTQAARTRALEDFKKWRVQILVATDIAARGLDIEQLPHVVNFDLPYVPEDYVHRIGRTARAGCEGEAVSLVSIDELKQLRDIERMLKAEIPKSTIPGFEVDKSIKPEAPRSRGRRMITIPRQEHAGHSGHKVARPRFSKHRRTA
ncbi:MAG: DEAD/DEAH box helicase [Nitrospinae bacterium]|nr:DEAD/DEAH box helicase [Nitrospinota bacterium]